MTRLISLFSILIISTTTQGGIFNHHPDSCNDCYCVKPIEHVCSCECHHEEEIPNSNNLSGGGGGGAGSGPGLLSGLWGLFLIPAFNNPPNMPDNPNNPITPGTPIIPTPPDNSHTPTTPVPEPTTYLMALLIIFSSLFLNLGQLKPC